MSKLFDINTVVDPSMEAIAVQSSEFKNKLIEAVANLRMAVKEQERVGDKLIDISALVSDYTNITFDVQLSNSFGMGFPAILANHPLNSEITLLKASKFSDFKELMEGKTDFQGEVDTKKMKVNGDFKNLLFDMFLDRKAMGDDEITDGMIAAMIAHEVGHAFTWCATINRTSSNNMVLRSMSMALMKLGDDQDRKKVIDLAMKNKELNDYVKSKKKALSKNISDMNEAEMMNLLTSASIELGPRSSIGSREYDNVSMEQMADQFMSRVGLGLDGVQARDYYNKKYKTPGTMTRLDWVIADISAQKGFLIDLVVYGTTQLFTNYLVDMLQTYNDPSVPKPKLDFSRLKKEVVDNIISFPSKLRKYATSILEFIKKPSSIYEGITLIPLEHGTWDSTLHLAYYVNKVVENTLLMYTNFSSIHGALKMLRYIVVKPMENSADTLVNMESLNYDRDMVQLKRIKEDLIKQLNYPGLNDKMKKQIMHQVEGIKVIIDTYENKSSLFKPIIDILNLGPSWFHDKRNQEELQRRLEELSANELFLAANKLKHM